MNRFEMRPNRAVVNVRYPDLKTGELIDNVWYVKPASFKTYKEFIYAALKSAKLVYLPIKSFVTKNPDGSIEEVKPHTFRISAQNRYVITVIQPIFQVMKIYKKIDEWERKKEEYCVKTGH
uniref:NGN domain-containing protein n=1 Tax=Panagrellus redivivus TaxID=6233 RepID=A0A7E4UVJ3_PANRE